ncbi:MAG: hypothetical protein U5K79_23775 [Cyclobacteriaceae bacterium]|nr:hypothetical protein [Cyclobacteriaceae bacterium]
MSEDIYPLNANLKITLKPRLNYTNKEKYLLTTQRISKTSLIRAVSGSIIHSNLERCTLGKYTLLADTIPPKSADYPA